MLVGGVGGARYLLGLRAHLRDLGVDPADAVTAVVNTGDDLTLFGLRVCPDLDTVVYTLGGGIDPERGWGRADETYTLREELAAYDPESTWFTLGDRDLATHLTRTRLLEAGATLSEVTAALCDRWQPGVRVLPATDARVETHVVCEVDGRRRAVHFQRWWVGLRAAPEPLAVVSVGAEETAAAPGVREALADADLVVLAPSNPVVSIGTVLAVPGVRDALVSGPAPVVGLSPVVAGRPIRGMADRLLPAVGAQVSAAGVARHYGARRDGGLLDGWLVHTDDADDVAPVRALGIACEAVPLLMTDVGATSRMAAATLDLAGRLPR